MENTAFGRVQERFIETQRPVATRLAPFTSLSVTATTSGTAQTFATVGSDRAMLVKRLVAVNVTTVASKLSIHAVPSGGSISASNAVLVDYTIAGETAVNLTDIIGGFYAQGTSIVVWEQTAASVTLSGYYEDVF